MLSYRIAFAIILLVVLTNVATELNYDPNDAVSVQIAQLDAIKHLSDKLETVVANQNEVLKSSKSSFGTRVLEIIADYLFVVFILFCFKQMLSLLDYLLVQKSDYYAEVRLLIHDTHAIFRSGEEVRSISNLRVGYTPPLCVRLVRCCKRDPVPAQDIELI